MCQTEKKRIRQPSPPCEKKNATIRCTPPILSAIFCLCVCTLRLLLDLSVAPDSCDTSTAHGGPRKNGESQSLAWIRTGNMAERIPVILSDNCPRKDCCCCVAPVFSFSNFVFMGAPSRHTAVLRTNSRHDRRNRSYEVEEEARVWCYACSTTRWQQAPDVSTYCSPPRLL